jgi:hypothetical protein
MPPEAIVMSDQHSRPTPDHTPDPTDDQMDQLLRAAGARLRETGTDMATTDTPTSRRRRWVVPASLGAVAAATIAVIIGVTGQNEESIESPVVTEPSVPTEPTTPTEPTEPTTPTEPTEPTAPGTSAPGTTPPAEATVTVTDVGWDGPGSGCLTLDGVTGCVPSGVVRDGRAPTNADVIGESDRWQLTLLLRDGELVAEPAAPAPARRATDLDSPVWLVDVVESTTGDSAIRGVLPTGPEGAVRYEVLRDSFLLGDTDDPAPIPLTILTDTIPIAARGDTVFRVYETRVPNIGVEVRCLLTAPVGGDGWYETCDLDDPTPRGGLFVHEGELLHLDLLSGDLVALGDAPVRSNGCETPARDLLDTLTGLPVVYRGLGCDEGAGLAAGSFGFMAVQQGTPDGGLVEWVRDDAGAWSVSDTGTGIEPTVLALPVPPASFIQLDRPAAALPIEDVTELIRGWIDESPGATIEEAIAEGETGDSGELVMVETLVPAYGLPTLVAIEVTYPDDSVGGARYAVWITEPDDDSSPYMLAYRWLLCSRGLAEGVDEPLCI